jgi:hypothetical protein
MTKNKKAIIAEWTYEDIDREYTPITQEEKDWKAETKSLIDYYKSEPKKKSYSRAKKEMVYPQRRYL